MYTALPKVFTNPPGSLNSGVPISSMASGVLNQAPSMQMASVIEWVVLRSSVHAEA